MLHRADFTQIQHWYHSDPWQLHFKVLVPQGCTDAQWPDWLPAAWFLSPIYLIRVSTKIFDWQQYYSLTPPPPCQCSPAWDLFPSPGINSKCLNSESTGTQQSWTLRGRSHKWDPWPWLNLPSGVSIAWCDSGNKFLMRRQERWERAREQRGTFLLSFPEHMYKNKCNQSNQESFVF